MRSILLVWFLCFVVAGDSGSQARAPATVAVLFPDVAEPARSIFMKIIDGIEEKSHAKVLPVPLSASNNVAELSGQLHRQDVRTVIALGRQGIKASASLDPDFKILIGGIINVTPSDGQHWPVRSMNPDPALLFARLKNLMPQARRVYVVYDPQQNAWLIALAQHAARAQGLELVATEAGDISTALRMYQQIISRNDPKTDALWLPQDNTTVQDAVVLPLLLRSTWSNNLAVFSSNFNHVSQGVLFALYPDIIEYGKKLGQLSQQSNLTPGLLPLREVQAAINKSTASHLRLNLSQTQLEEFRLIFPER